jgi:hypothetical protein
MVEIGCKVLKVRIELGNKKPTYYSRELNGGICRYWQYFLCLFILQLELAGLMAGLFLYYKYGWNWLELWMR